MESYRDFARVYDEFMDQTPYDEWLLNILNIFKEYKIDKDAQVLDLGCGTGKMARKLAREGYQVTAVDNSMDMLEIIPSRSLVYLNSYFICIAGHGVIRASAAGRCSG